MMRQHLVIEHVRDKLSFFIHNETKGKNPYLDADATLIAEEIAKHFVGLIRKENSTSAIELDQAIRESNSPGANIAPLVIRNCFFEPIEDLVAPREPRGFDYGTNPADRMKKGFVTEWASWAIGIAFNLENATHPAEHGGGNRFHMISPISEADASLRLTGASTGGGRFHLHNDASVYTAPLDKSTVIDNFKKFGTSLETVSHRLGKPAPDIISEISCGRFMRVDFTMLSGVVNQDTETYISTPEMLHNHLIKSGYDHAPKRKPRPSGRGQARQASFGAEGSPNWWRRSADRKVGVLHKSDIHSLSKMPVAHFAGPADGDISGYIGNISPPIFLDNQGNIDAICINLADSRMKYVGSSQTENNLFERFVLDARSAPHHKIVISSGDTLPFPNSPFGSQKNVMHGRGELKDSDYRIEVSPRKFMRRVHCRQYLTSRARDGKKNFLASL